MIFELTESLYFDQINNKHLNALKYFKNYFTLQHKDRVYQDICIFGYFDLSGTELYYLNWN